jgi:ribosomal protein L24E
MRAIRWLLVVVLAAVVQGLNLSPGTLLGRRAAVGLCSAAFAGAPLLRPANAASSGKYDKKFEECLSKCVYDVTKITKGIGQVEVTSRTEAYGICKPKCATSKDQLLLGQPKK